MTSNLDLCSLPIYFVIDKLDFVSFLSLSIVNKQLSKELSNHRYWTSMGRYYFPGRQITSKEQFFIEARVVHLILNNQFNSLVLCNTGETQSLHFFSMGFLRSDPKFTRVKVQESLTIQNLVETTAVLKSFRHLVRLKVDLDVEGRAQLVNQLIGHLPPLKSITLITPSLNDEVIESVSQNHSELISLKIITLAHLSERSLKAISKLKNLQTLIYQTGEKDVSAHDVVKALENMNSLVRLIFEGAYGWTGKKILKVKAFKKLEVLRLNGVGKLKNSDLKKIAKAPMQSISLQDLPPKKYKFSGSKLKFFELKTA